MKNGDDTRVLYWRRLVVDLFTGAATLGVAFAAISAISTTDDVLYMLLIVGALINIGLMLEPKITAQPARDIGPRLSTHAT